MDEEAPQKPRVRHKPEDYYSPILCEVCGDEMFQEVQLVIRCPLGWNSLSKEGMRSRMVKIKGAYWDEVRWTCGCAERRPTKEQRHPSMEKKLGRPGKRWYKNLVPAKPDPRAINPHRPRKRRRKKPRPTEL